MRNFGRGGTPLLALSFSICAKYFLSLHSARSFAAVPGSKHSYAIVLQSSHRDPSSSPSQESGKSSVGDYVRGVHAGKYQFEEAGAASFAGQQFAEALYCTDSTDGIIKAGNDGDESLPRWAETMGTSATMGVTPPMERYDVLDLYPDSSASVTICNDERSWEHFYCKYVQVNSDGSILDETAAFVHEARSDALFQIIPATGYLAPRGGSSNLCDPSNPYSDSATIHISRIPNVQSATYLGSQYLLIMGTEAEKWCYWLQLSSNSLQAWR